MEQLTVDLGGDSYPFHIGEGLLDRAAAHIRPGANIALVSDRRVWELYGERMRRALNGFAVHPVIVKQGEQSKSLDCLTGLYGSFAEARITREDLVIAFGGGVVGDLAGFAAATWMRGVACLQIPTTLLAQVDSSVGGKTAVNLPQGKNLVGAFYQPSAVLIDTGVLDTLPEREWRCGLAEVVKYGCIRSRELYDQLQRPVDRPDLTNLIRSCCAIKAGVVAKDELDRGERMLLNFGHTFGHGVEQLGGYSTWNHGEGVAIGMVLAAKIGQKLGVTPAGTAEGIAAALAVHGLPTVCPCDPIDLLPALGLDKKSGGGSVKLILLRAIGDAVIHPVSHADLETLLREVER